MQSEQIIREGGNQRHRGDLTRQRKEGLERAQRLLKQSQKRDYYKILGVKR